MFRTTVASSPTTSGGARYQTEVPSKTYPPVTKSQNGFPSAIVGVLAKTAKKVTKIRASGLVLISAVCCWRPSAVVGVPATGVRNLVHSLLGYSSSLAGSPPQRITISFLPLLASPPTTTAELNPKQINQPKTYSPATKSQNGFSST